mgnify:CR=1 FL=1
MKQEKTLGEKRVRTSFNPGDLDYIDQIKNEAAKLIDIINQAAANPKWDDETTKEWLRFKALSMTAFEEGAMWGVKAATI